MTWLYGAAAILGTEVALPLWEVWALVGFVVAVLVSCIILFLKG